ncbi:MAG: NAD(P)-dependent oxidoreductase [Propionibacteriaceae bacterium]|nr:NAD(P)-dependent oxidoreductase [Propionibacteriaceae bacterium]
MILTAHGELPLTASALERLAGLSDTGELAGEAEAAQVLLVGPRTPLPADALASYPQLRHVAVCGTSVGRLDLDALRERGISWSVAVDYGDDPAAEVMFHHLVAVMRGIGPVRWRPTSHEVAGKRLVVVGLGALGIAVARLALGFGMDVAHISRTPKPEWEARGVARVDRSALADADVVVLCGPTHVPVLDAADFARLGDAILIQGSLGHVFDHASFADWVAGDQRVAIFDQSTGDDVLERVVGLPHVVVSPISAGLSQEAMERLGDQVVANVERVMAGGGPGRA